MVTIKCAVLCLGYCVKRAFFINPMDFLIAELDFSLVCLSHKSSGNYLVYICYMMPIIYKTGVPEVEDENI